MSSPGKLFLIGAGPGDPELLTLKAVRALRECDVVLYDRLVSKEVLAFARSDAKLIYVGKHEGEQEHAQSQILRHIVEYAAQGKTIGRLKSGDPLIFGRGGEEWAVAIEHGIAFELIPGITSSIAVPGLAGIPLTFRKLSQSFAVITGHCFDDSGFDPKGAGDWARYAQVDTLVILMGVRNRAAIAKALIEAGRAADEPVAFVYQGSRPEQVVVESTLAEVSNGLADVKNPAVFIIGPVVKLRDRLVPATAAIPAPPESEEPA